MNIVYGKEKIFVSIYNRERFLFNILDNNLVPPHRILSETEKEAIEKQFNIIHKQQFPEISRYDPVALAIGLRPGQLVEITRKQCKIQCILKVVYT